MSALVALVSFGPASSAEAASSSDVRVKGGIKGGGSVLLTLNRQGRVEAATVRWTADCGGGLRFRTGTSFDLTRRPSKSGSIRVADAYGFRQRGYRFKVGVLLIGRERKLVTYPTAGGDDVDEGEGVRPATNTRWRGKFRAVALVYRGGSRTDRCALHGRRWTGDSEAVDAASGAGTGSVTMTGDAGDRFGPGHRVYTALTLTGNTQVIKAEAGDFSLVFEAPDGGTLRPGAYENARRFPFHEPGAGLDVSGGNRFCTPFTGRFVIVGIGYDHFRRVSSVDLYFEQHCGPDALSGHLVFARAD